MGLDVGMVSASNGTVAVGASGFAGGAYLYELDVENHQLEMVCTVLPAPAMAFDDRYGFSVAMDGSWVVVGSPDVDRALVDQGEAYVFMVRDC